MIKMLVSARKKPGMTDQAYSDYWGINHGALVRVHGQDMGFRRYIQTHLTDLVMPPALVGTEGPDTHKNGQAELWWDSIEAMLATGETPEGQAASLLFEEDEKRFCDVGNLSAFLAVETVLVDTDPDARYAEGAGPKLMVELWRRPDAPSYAAWLDEHRVFIDRWAGEAKALRYIVNCPLDDERFNFAHARGWKPAPDAVIELWFASDGDLRAAMTGDSGARWKAKIGRFGDTGRLRPLIGRPRRIFDAIEHA